MSARLAVCMIARDEAANLPVALRSVAGVADELIVVDTGSRDATPQIAAEFGARVGYFAWSDDFAAARNAALDLATAHWVLWLDADEELRPESAAELRAAVDDPRGLARLVLRRDLCDRARPGFFTRMWQLRLFRRRPDLRFIGRCHPHFPLRLESLAVAEGLTYGPSEIELNHYGYIEPGVRLSKAQRAVRLLELELRDRPGQLYYLVELGRTLLQFDPPRGIAVLGEAAQLLAAERGAPQPSSPACALLLEHLLQVPPPLPGGFTPEEVRALCERWFPRAAPLIWLRAREDYAAGRFAACERRLRQLLQMGRDGTYDQWVSFDPAIISEDAQLCLAACLVRQARLDEADSLLRPLAADARLGPAARENLAAIARLRRLR